MLRRKLMAGTTSVQEPIFAQDTTSSTGGGLSGLAYSSAGLTVEYRGETDAAWTAVTLVAGTLGTYASGGFAADGSLVGSYVLGVPNNALLAARGKSCRVRWYGATNMLAGWVDYELDAVNYQDAQRFGLGSLPATGTLAVKPAATLAAADVTGSLPTDAYAYLAANLGANGVALSALVGLILATPANKLATDANGRVGVNNFPVEFLSSAEQTELTTAINDLNSLLGRTDTAGTVSTIQQGVTNLLARLGQALLFDGSGNVKSAPQTPVMLVSGSSVTVAGGVTVNGFAGGAITAAAFSATALAGQTVAAVSGNVGGNVGGNVNGSTASVTATIRATDGSGSALSTATGLSNASTAIIAAVGASGGSHLTGPNATTIAWQSSTGTPVSGVSYTLSGATIAPQFGTSNTSGQAFAGLPDGNGYSVVSAVGLMTFPPYAFNVSGGTTTTQTITATATVVIPPPAVTGDVVCLGYAVDRLGRPAPNQSYSVGIRSGANPKSGLLFTGGVVTIVAGTYYRGDGSLVALSNPAQVQFDAPGGYSLVFARVGSQPGPAVPVPVATDAGVVALGYFKLPENLLV